MDYINKLYKKINKNNTFVLVFGISTCGYCKETIKYLQEKNIPVTDVADYTLFPEILNEEVPFLVNIITKNSHIW